jgi:tRNA (guanine37-N1)-methyltransferase
MEIDVITLFPEMFPGVFGTSIIGRAQKAGIVRIQLIDFRTYSTSKHKTVDDAPYGGGGGMVLRPEPVFRAVEACLVQSPVPRSRSRVILLCPQGVPYTQQKAVELAEYERLVLICGHYEGYDERIREHLVDEEISIGDYVLTGGEIPAMVIVDSVVRLLPGALGNTASAARDSFRTGLLEHPHYTRPSVFRGWEVPGVLLSGNHHEIERWRRREALRRTYERRPELLARAELSEEDRAFLEELRRSGHRKD